MQSNTPTTPKKKYNPNKKFFNKKAVVPLTRHQKIKKTLNWLCKNYPNLFKRKYPKPIKVGIAEDILALNHPWIEKKILQATLRSYIYRIPYINCLMNYTDRYDLKGEKCGIVEKIHKDFAMKKMMESLAKAKKIAEKI